MIKLWLHTPAGLNKDPGRNDVVTQPLGKAFLFLGGSGGELGVSGSQEAKKPRRSR